MAQEMMDMEQLAAYLRRDVREVGKLASRGHLPGHKVGGQWRFARSEINYWIETQLHEYSDEQLSALDGRGSDTVLLTDLLSVASIAVPLPASTKSSVLRELVSLAEMSWQVYDADAILQAIRTREEMASTALPHGVAIPHPRRPLPNALGDAVMAYGRTSSGIPFGGERGSLTDIFFLVCCRDDATHLQVLARLTRLMQLPGFLDELRAAETPAETLEKIRTAEAELGQG
jgi:PTS system nitrogen regulatory IIA component